MKLFLLVKSLQIPGLEEELALRASSSLEETLSLEYRTHVLHFTYLIKQCIPGLPTSLSSVIAPGLPRFVL